MALAIKKIKMFDNIKVKRLLSVSTLKGSG